MAGSTSNLDLISSSQASKEVTANALFDASSPATLYGRRASTTSALTWGFYGGMIDIAGAITAIANGTVALTASITNYIVASRATGAVSASTTTTNWNNSTGYIRLYSIVAGASSVTSYTDFRTTLHTQLVGDGLISYRIAGVALGGQRIVVLDASGQAIYADNTTLTHANKVIGMTTGAVSLGGTAIIQTRGSITEPTWAWTLDQPIFLSTTGLLTQTQPITGFSIVVGFPISATSLFIAIGEPLIR